MKHLDLPRALGVQVLSRLAPCLAFLCTADKRKGGIVPCFAVALECPFPSLCLAERVSTSYLHPFSGGTAC